MSVRQSKEIKKKKISYNNHPLIVIILAWTDLITRFHCTTHPTSLYLNSISFPNYAFSSVLLILAFILLDCNESVQGIIRPIQGCIHCLFFASSAMANTPHKYLILCIIRKFFSVGSSMRAKPQQRNRCCGLAPSSLKFVAHIIPLRIFDSIFCMLSG